MRLRRASCHTAVWTGTEMIVWGGTRPHSVFNNGGALQSGRANTWTATTTATPAAARSDHTAVWTGERDDRLGRTRLAVAQ